MINNYKILTITHRKTNLKDIGQFIIKHTDTDELRDRLAHFKAAFGIDELMYLATCNRITFLFYTPIQFNKKFVTQFFQEINSELSETLINDKVVSYVGEKALEHVYEMAASIDSLVVGEREILRQFRQAYEQCKNWKFTGDNLRLLINSVVEGAKNVYAQTRIGEKPVSIVSLAIQKLLKSNLPRDARILLIGAGQTNTLVGKFLAKYQFKNVTIFNRTLAKAEQLATLINGNAKGKRLSALADFQEGFDAIIVCTGVTKAIIDVKLYRNLLQEEQDKKLIIDLAIPNNVSKEVVETFTTNYIEIEDLRQLAKINLAFREEEVAIARKQLASYIQAFPTIYQHRQISRAMRHVPAEIKAIKSHAINNVFHKEVSQLDDSARLLVEKMLDYMEKRCIGIPMKAAKEAIS